MSSHRQVGQPSLQPQMSDAQKRALDIFLRAKSDQATNPPRSGSMAHSPTLPSSNLGPSSVSPMKETVVTRSKPSPSRTSPSEPAARESSMRTSKTTMRKLQVDVGGQKFAILFTFLRYLSIEPVKLLPIRDKAGDVESYFLDRDPDYFSRILADFGAIGPDGIAAKGEDYSDNMIAELVHYQLIHTSPITFPLTVSLSTTRPATRILTITCGEHRFVVTDRTWSLTKLPSENTTLDYRPRDLRIVVNLLRTGESPVYHQGVLAILDDLGVDYSLGGEPAKTIRVSCNMTGREVALQSLAQSYHAKSLPWSNRKYYHPVNWSTVPEIRTTTVAYMKEGLLQLQTPISPDLVTRICLQTVSLPPDTRITVTLGDNRVTWHLTPRLCVLHSAVYGEPEPYQSGGGRHTYLTLPLGLIRGSHLPLCKEELTIQVDGGGEMPVWITGVQVPLGINEEQSNSKLLSKPTHYLYLIYQTLEARLTSVPEDPHITSAVIPLTTALDIRDLYLTLWSSADWVADDSSYIQTSGTLLSLTTFYQTGEEERHFSLTNGVIASHHDPIELLHCPAPPGVYYHSYCAEPRSERSTGKLPGGEGWFLRVTTRLPSGYVRVHLRTEVMHTA